MKCIECSKTIEEDAYVALSIRHGTDSKFEGPVVGFCLECFAETAGEKYVDIIYDRVVQHAARKGILFGGRKPHWSPGPRK